MKPQDYNTNVAPNWCPGCGDFGIWAAFKQTLVDLNIPAHEAVVSFGIGCHGHAVNFTEVTGFEGLHGRPLPVAQGIKLANPNLNVFVMTGDGDSLAEGGNHLLHAIRRNIDITMILFDNQIYGLTTGQASPASEKGHKTKTTPNGNIEEPISPVHLGLSLGASFVARGFAGDVPHLTELMKKAVEHKGFAILDILQPCVTFNKLNTYEYFRKKIYKLEEKGHDPANFDAAFSKATEWEKGIPIGILYQVDKPTYESQLIPLKGGPLVSKTLKPVDVSKLLEKFK